MATVANKSLVGILLAASVSLVYNVAAARGSLVDRDTIMRIAPRSVFISRYQYKSATRQVAEELRSALAECKRLPRDFRQACADEAQASEKAATALLDARYMNTLEAQRRARLLRIDSDYSVERQKCHGLASAVRSDCLKEAQLRYRMS